MKNVSGFKIFLTLSLFLWSHVLYSQTEGFSKIKWERKKIAPGLVWKSSHTLIQDSIPQNINLLIINLQKRKLLVSYDPSGNIVVSKQAGTARALAAVNAGFFNIKDGGSVTYIRTGGIISDADTAKKWSRNNNMTGSILIDKRGHIKIDSSHMNSWYDSHPEYPDVLLTGPLLLTADKKPELPRTSLVTVRHPRTALGKCGNNKVILITLDGRTDQSKGMTLAELTNFMISLKCNDAINLDGGGSTTMWISGEPFDGVVNMPCDNKKFDHAGERPVSDILIIR
jgi:exopolysaccharide biosynthesis protein